MNKQSLDYSKSIQATFGKFYPRFGNFESINYIDKIIEEGNISVTTIKRMVKIISRVNQDFSELKIIKNSSTMKHAFSLFKTHYLNEVDTIQFEDKRLNSLIKNFIVTKCKNSQKYPIGDDGSIGEELLAGISEIEEKCRAVRQAVRDLYFPLNEALEIYKVTREQYGDYLLKYPIY